MGFIIILFLHKPHFLLNYLKNYQNIIKRIDIQNLNNFFMILNDPSILLVHIKSHLDLEKQSFAKQVDCKLQMEHACTAQIAKAYIFVLICLHTFLGECVKATPRDQAKQQSTSKLNSLHGLLKCMDIMDIISKPYIMFTAKNLEVF